MNWTRTILDGLAMAAYFNLFAAAVALYVGIGWVISLLFSIVGVLAMVGDTGTASFMLGVVSVMQTVVNLAVAGGGVALSAYLVRAKVDLS